MIYLSQKLDEFMLLKPSYVAFKFWIANKLLKICEWIEKLKEIQSSKQLVCKLKNNAYVPPIFEDEAMNTFEFNELKSINKKKLLRQNLLWRLEQVKEYSTGTSLAEAIDQELRLYERRNACACGLIRNSCISLRKLPL